MNDLSNKSKYYCLLMFALVLYSFTSLFSKLASINSASLRVFVICYFCIIFILGIYAIIWQQILKHIDLSIAMSFKPLVLVLNCTWASVFFKETINIKMIFGIVLIIIGLIIIGIQNE